MQNGMKHKCVFTFVVWFFGSDPKKENDSFSLGSLSVHTVNFRPEYNEWYGSVQYSTVLFAMKIPDQA